MFLNTAAIRTFQFIDWSVERDCDTWVNCWYQSDTLLNRNDNAHFAAKYMVLLVRDVDVGR